MGYGGVGEQGGGFGGEADTGGVAEGSSSGNSGNAGGGRGGNLGAARSAAAPNASLDHHDAALCVIRHPAQAIFSSIL